MFGKICSDPPEALLYALGKGSHPTTLLEANDTYIAIYENQAAIQNICPDFSELEQLHPFAVSVTAPGDEADFVSRYFAPSYGIPEDPVTGSVHCALTPYWAERLGKKQLYAQQISDRGGELWCELAADRVLIKGNAILTLQGSLQI
jgi:predicted PhzF superfamily epimerase YddE/YHI9